ncbi:MAG: hypothetical protein QNJ46_30065, partial [Leptolyngbyaceae cyanobacterium MO_188.B28]|nr:hypothetical protein [Leptolyngbyaceae cyanobacterium MO_188.B28]
AADPITFARNVLAILLNGLIIVLVVNLLRYRHYRGPILSLSLLSITALAVSLPLDLPERFTYFSQMFVFPLFVYALSKYMGDFSGRSSSRPSAKTWRQNWTKIWVAPLLAASIVVGPLYASFDLASKQPDLAAENLYTRQLTDTLIQGIKDPNISRVYLINDVTTRFGSLSYLKMVAAMADRKDLTVRVINSIKGYNPDSATEGEGVQVQRVDDELQIANRLGPDEVFFFPGVAQSNLQQLGVGLEEIISYSNRDTFQQTKTLRVSIPHASRNDYLLIGFDPGAPGIHLLTPNDDAWRAAAS